MSKGIDITGTELEARKQAMYSRKLFRRANLKVWFLEAHAKGLGVKNPDSIESVEKTHD